MSERARTKGHRRRRCEICGHLFRVYCRGPVQPAHAPLVSSVRQSRRGLLSSGIGSHHRPQPSGTSTPCTNTPILASGPMWGRPSSGDRDCPCASSSYFRAGFSTRTSDYYLRMDWARLRQYTDREPEVSLLPWPIAA